MVEQELVLPTWMSNNKCCICLQNHQSSIKKKKTNHLEYETNSLYFGENNTCLHIVTYRDQRGAQQRLLYFSFLRELEWKQSLSLLPKQSGTKTPQYVLWYFDDGILGFWFLGTPWVDWGLLPVLSSRVMLMMLVAPGGVRDWTWGSYMQNMHNAHKTI